MKTKSKFFRFLIFFSLRCSTSIKCTVPTLNSIQKSSNSKSNRNSIHKVNLFSLFFKSTIDIKLKLLGVSFSKLVNLN